MEMANTRTPSASARSIKNVAGRQSPDALAESAPHQLISGEHLAAEILRQKQHRNDDARQQISEHQLQKLEIAGE